MKTISKYLIAGLAGLISGCPGSNSDPILTVNKGTYDRNTIYDTSSQTGGTSSNDITDSTTQDITNQDTANQDLIQYDTTSQESQPDSNITTKVCDMPLQYLPSQLPNGLSQQEILCEYSTEEDPVDYCLSRYADATDQVIIGAFKTEKEFFTYMVESLHEDFDADNFQGFYLSDSKQTLVLISQQGLLEKDYLTSLISQIHKQCQPLEVVDAIECQLSNFYQDADGDLEGNVNNSKLGCGEIIGYVNNSTDCNDANDKIGTTSEEIKDGVDNNCDGQIDEGFAELPEEFKYLMDDDAVLGNPKAPVSIVAFIDYEDPFNKMFFDEILPQIKELYINTGKVSYTARDFPLSFHPNAQSAAEAAECAGEQNMYYEMHDKLFENGVENGFNSYLPPANELGLDMGAFTFCLFSKAHEDEVKQDFADGVEYGVNGTPAFFINGELISGAQPFEIFKQKIEEKLD